MSKKLKIQFWKADKGLVMQILEQEGLPKEKGDGYVRIYDSPALIFKRGVWLRGRLRYADFKLGSIYFVTNVARDAYLEKIVNAITDELFTGKGELKIGEMCEVRNSESGEWDKRKLIAVLPAPYEKRFITEMEDYPTEHYSWRYARTIHKRTEPTVEECGQLVTYTWDAK